jgi:hypothetical protein
MTQWLSQVPEKCDTCDTPITNKFYDAKTKMGPWACMCPTCQVLGPGINKVGLGLGQEYTKTKVDGKIIWKKTAG